MKRQKEIKFDSVGYWSEVKLDIVKEYAAAYSTILSNQKDPTFSHAYIDAFAGFGVHISRETGEFILGSPLNALLVEPSFHDYYLIDIDSVKVATLKEIVGNRENVHIYEGNCNAILLNEIFPKVLFEHYRRGLCVLDPYGLHLNWQVIYTAGQMRSIDIFINFLVMDINRNVLWRNPDAVGPEAISRMDQFWGDSSWRDMAYSTNQNLFGHPEKEDNITVAEAFRKRLKDDAGFEYVSEALPMRNSRNATVYYLLFASQKPVAFDIIKDIFKKYR